MASLDFGALLRDELNRLGAAAKRYDFEQEPVFEKFNPITGEVKVYPLHERQREVWNAPEPDVAAIAGAQSGKTSLIPWLIAREIQRKGGGNALIVGPTYPLMDRQLVPTCERVWGQKLGMGEYKFGRRQFVFSPVGLAMLGVKDASVFFGFAEDPESLESMEAVVAACDEAGQSKFSREAIEAIRRRLALARGRIFYSTTPYSWNWFKTDISDKAALDPGCGIRVVNYESRDNPLFSQEEWERMEKLLPAWKFDMMYRGRFTRPLGQVLSHFNPEKHVIKPFNIPWHWQRATGHDFGEVNTAAVKWARNPETGQWIQYWDYHEGKIPVEDHVAAFKHGRDESEADPWSYGGAPSEDNWRDQFTWAGWYIMKPPVKDLSVGLQVLNSMFANDELLIFDTCPRTIRQMQEMSYEILPNGDINPAKVENEKSYHLVAASRYVGIGVSEAYFDGGTTTSAYKF